jgi:hypothetical protein
MIKFALQEETILDFLDSQSHGEAAQRMCCCAYNNPGFRRKLAPDNFLRPSNYLGRYDTLFQESLETFKETAVSATFSPHNSDNNRPGFVPTDTLLDLDYYLSLRSDCCWKNQHIVYLGPKGSGKTSTHNYWLSMNRRNLENNNILYIRCDAQRLFDSWSIISYSDKNIDADLMPTIDEYFDFQLLAVLAWDMNKDCLAARILRSLNDENVTFAYKESRAADSSQYIPKSISWYITEHILRRLDNSYDDYVVENLFRDKQFCRREYFRWQQCAVSVKRYLKDRNIKLMLILDGIDNLHLNTAAGINLYYTLLPQLTKFILRRGASNELKLAVMRDRTWIDVQLNDASAEGYYTSVEPEIIQHKPPETSRLIESRIIWMIQEKMSNDCIETLRATLQSLPRGEVIQQNMRTLIISSATLAEQIRYRWHQLGKNINIASQAQKFMKRNLFLNGSFFLETQRNIVSRNREKGLPYINPFWMDESFFQSKNQPSYLLLRVRILELLHKASLSDALLKRFLVNAFGYNNDAVDQAIQDGRAFGWIDSRREETSDCEIIYDISPSGIYLLTDLLNDIDTLYTLALDTPLPQRFFDKGLIAVHDNHLHKRSGYIGAVLVTVLSFLSWLYAIKRVDLRLINYDILEDFYEPVFLESRSINVIASALCSRFKAAHKEDLHLFECAYKSIICYPENTQQ